MNNNILNYTVEEIQHILDFSLLKEPLSLTDIEKQYIKNNLGIKEAAAITELTIANWGFTKNIGTITGIRMNGTSKGLSGIVDLGTVITSHQDISGKVDKVDGKGLSTNDYTTAEKNKLAGIASGAEVNVQSDWNITDITSDAYIKNKPSLSTVATSGNYSDLLDKPSIDSVLSTTSTNSVLNKAVTIGINAKYTKPSTGIPKSDLASSVLTSLGKADTALQSVPSEYITESELAAKGYTTNIGTVTAVKMNGTSISPSEGIVDLGTIITAHQDISGKLDSTIAASTYLTKTDAASTYLGKVEKAASATEADSATKATQDASGNIITSTYATKTEVNGILEQIDTLVSGNANTAIESFNEIIDFLANIEDTETLEGIIAGINANISSKADKSLTITDITRNGTTFTATRADGSTFTFTQQDSDTTYSNKTAVSGGTEESLVTTGEKYIWNTKGTYSKPSTGIPKIDLADDVQMSINKANTALLTIPSEYITETELASKKYTTEAYVNSAIANAKLEGSDIVIPVEDVMVNGTSAIVDRIAQIDLSDYANKTDLDSKLNIISDLVTIRQGAALGATALQSYTEKYTGTYSKPNGGIPKTDFDTSVQASLSKADTAIQSHQDISGKADKASLSKVATSGSYNDLTDKPTIPNAVTESTVTNWGFTKNTGTITGIKMNGVSKGTSGVVDLGTVITSHQDISGKQDVISDLEQIREFANKGATALQSVPSEYVTETELVNKGYATTSALNTKVDKVNGKQLSTEDFTTALKTKLEGLNNYNDAAISTAISSLQTQLDTLVSGNANDAINSFNEIIAFLDNIKDDLDLSSIITSIEQQIASKQDKISDLATIRSGAALGATALQSYTEKYTGTYSKPSTGIPKSDLASAVLTSLGKADTALQSYTETDPVFSASAAAGIKSSDISNWNSKTSNIGTITGIKMNGVSKGVSGVVDLGTVITSHLDISGKLDATTAANTYATKTEVKTAKSEANNYTDTKIANLINGAPTTLDTLDEIAAALKDNADIVDVLNQSIGSKQDTISDLETIRSGAAKGATALQSYTEKYTGTYSKPSAGIPKIDLSSDVQNSLTKADSALQEETYKGTVTTSNIEDNPNISEILNYYVKPSTGIPKYDLSADVAESLDKANNAPSKTELNNALSLKVDKLDGKKLTTEDFTSELKTKLESLNNYDDTSVKNAFEILRNDFNTLINGDTSSSINSFNKIINFLNGVEVSKSLNGIVSTIELQIENTNKNIPTKTSQLTNDSGYLNSATAVLNIVYPVGAVYISITPENLFDIFGFGTWELIKDTFLLGAGDVYLAGSTGGEATHKLTTSEMPSHSHNTYQIANYPNGIVDNRGGYGYTEVANSRTSYGSVVGSTGGSQPHNNMPPYLTVYIWKRIA